MSAQAFAGIASNDSQSEREVADNLFWLSKMHQNLPRAQVIPDFKRSTGSERRYQQLAFSLDPEVVRVLKSLDSTRGVTDLVLCVTLLTVVLAKYHREDELIVGLLGPERSVVPLRLPCAAHETALAIMRDVGNEIESVFRHLPCSASRMAQILNLELTATACPFFNIAVAVGDRDTTIDFTTYPVDLAFLFEVREGLVQGRVAYAPDLFGRQTIERLVSHFLNGAIQLGRQPSARLNEIDLLSEGERKRILSEFATSTARFPLDRTMHGLFEDQVSRSPGATAVVYGDVRLTYAELNSRANRLAHTLIRLGLGKGSFVGILLNRSHDFVVAMLAVFKAGGAYVPLDPTYPRDRLLYMLKDSEAAFVVSRAPLVDNYRDVLEGADRLRVVLCVDHTGATALAERGGALQVIGSEAIASARDTNPASQVDSADRAYMIYTSGSTGRPKGAICRHDGALNHLFGELEGLDVRGAFSFLQTAASSSDISVWQFIAPLLFGGSTVVVDYDDVVDPKRLFAAIRDFRVDVAELVPVVLRGLVAYIDELPPGERQLPALRYMMATGEGLATELAEHWLALYPSIPVANTYGPTETSDDVTLLVLRQPLAEKRDLVPIGKPLPNVVIFLLDRELRLVPMGVGGEICIGGVGVGEGYWRQPEKTKEAFVTSPFPETCGGTLYRTGDLGRWLVDGSIDFLGRIDQQVKIRGFRVEPGEVEAVLRQHACVEDGAVVAVADARGTNRLVGYFVPRMDQSISPADLRQYLKDALAEHLVPAALVQMSALPLTPLGKLDRKALTRIDYLEHIESEEYVAPRNSLERAIAGAWSAVLGVPRVGIHDNFFETGGDSILTIHVIAELKKIGLHVAPKDLFVRPTVAELAEYIGSSEQPEARALHVEMSEIARKWNLDSVRQQLSTVYPDIEDVYPLSGTQRGIYFQSILPSKNSGVYVEQIEFDLTGDISPEAFAASWQRTVDRTDVLRTAVVRRGVPQPMQVVVRSAKLVPENQDWRHLSEAEQHAALEALRSEDRRTGFDLAKAPLTRVTLIRLSETQWHVLWTYHHIILDGWSEPLVLGDVFAAYRSITVAEHERARAAPRYRDFVAWSEVQDMSAAEVFWRRQLEGFTAPIRVTDHSPAVVPPSNAELSHGADDIVLDEDETIRLQSVARRNRLTFSTIIHGAWGILLHRRTGSADIVFGSVASGRQCDLAEIASVRGVMVVSQPLRTRLVSDATVAAWLRLLQLQMAEIREFEHTPLAMIQQWCDVPAEKRPLFDTLVVTANYLGADLSNCTMGGAVLSNVAYSTQPLYALTLFVVGGRRTSIRIVYDKRRYAAATVRQLLDEYRMTLTKIGENAEQRLAALLGAD